jgi:hypothetical protein
MVQLHRRQGRNGMSAAEEVATLAVVGVPGDAFKALCARRL